MMISNNVPNVELCHELKTLGFPQKQPGFFWVKTDQFEYELCFVHKNTIIILGNIRSNIDIDNGLIKAPTLAELKEFLPSSIYSDSGRYWLEYIVSDNHISILYNRGTFDGGTYDCLFLVRDNSEADARAKAVIELARRCLTEAFDLQVGEDYVSKKVTE